MDHEKIRELIELISRSNFATFELSQKDFKLRLVKQPPAPAVASEIVAFPQPGATVDLPPKVVVTEQPTSAPAASAEEAVDDGLVDMKSPIVGTFYISPTPGAPPFVKIGSRIARGQVVCIIEAMKVMNEIEAEIDAEVVEIAVANGQPVEFGEVLFRLRPS